MKFLRRDKRGESPMKALIMVLLIIVLGAALFTTVYTTSSAAANSTTDAGQASMLNLLPMIFILIMIVGAFVALLKVLDVI